MSNLFKKRTPSKIQVCPNCLSQKVRRVSSMEGDIASHIAYLPPKFVCADCGWQGRLVIETDKETESENKTSNHK